MNRKLNIFIILLFSIIFSGTDGTLRGKITDSDGSALIGSQIYLPDISKGTTADLDGNFLILNVPVGTYKVKVQMIGYQTKILDNVSIIMDQTQWLNVSLPVASIEGEVVYVSAEKALVEKGTTSKKITIGKEAIETLPIRDVSQLYDLQSGVVKVESKSQGIPDHEDRGLEEVHVRGGRSGEIAYMIDGMYIRNPIYGGIGNGTRLNKFAIREFDWQPGGFNAEYGDAMSAVSNLHTMSGTNSFTYKFQYETSLLGAALGSRYDELRDYHDYNIGIGGPVPFFKKIKIWVSGQKTDQGAYKVYKFDNSTFRLGKDDDYTLVDMVIDKSDNPNWNNLKHDLTFPWDNIQGYRGFGFDHTADYFGKITYDITGQHKLTFSYWKVDAHRKSFKVDPESGYAKFLYWDNGQNEIFRETERKALEFNHTVNERSFYTLRISDFIQDQFIGVRWEDSDGDGYPDWYEWNNPAGSANSSNPYDAEQVPSHISESGIIYYDKRDGSGPKDWTSGWYHGAPVPGNYNWRVAENFYDGNQNGIYDEGPTSSDIFEPYGEDDTNKNGVWDGPVLVEEAIYRDGSYWLTPEMYADNEKFWDGRGAYLLYEGLNPWMTITDWAQNLVYITTTEPTNPSEGNFWVPQYYVNWVEEQIFGGSDKFFSLSTARTQEIRFDYTNQITNRWRARGGIDYKTHKLNFYEIKEPWLDASAFRQRFSEQFDDFGVDNTEYIKSDCLKFDYGEGNGVWDGPGYFDDPCYIGDGAVPQVWYPGESYDDFNGDGKWNDYVEPEEFAFYFQNTYEVPWMVINAGFRIDAVQYNTKVWADPNGGFSPYSPHWYFDCGTDLSQSNIDDGTFGTLMCPGKKYEYETPFYELNEYDEPVKIVKQIDDNHYYNPSWDGTDNIPYQILDAAQQAMSENGVQDPGEHTTSDISETSTHAKVIFKKSEWLYKISPRIGISHVIADGATFTFNYGVYYQTPIYEFIYRNLSKLEDPEQAFEDASKEASSIGNATMTAGRTQSYELAFNVQFSRRWAFSAGIWVKDMDQLTTANDYSSGIYEYKVTKNGDFGSAVGFDFTVENRGKIFNTTIQYTYSTAKASSEYDSAAFGSVQVDAPQQEFLMPYDRTHDLTLSLYTTKLPWGFNAGLTAFYQSGQPYTPVIIQGTKIRNDYKNKYSKRSPSLVTMNLSVSKSINVLRHSISLGANIFNLFDKPYPIDIHRITGNADYPGEYYDRTIGTVDGVSGSYYDRPWMYSNNREINFFIRIEFE